MMGLGILALIYGDFATAVDGVLHLLGDHGCRLGGGQQHPSESSSPAGCVTAIRLAFSADPSRKQFLQEGVVLLVPASISSLLRYGTIGSTMWDGICELL